MKKQRFFLYRILISVLLSVSVSGCMQAENTQKGTIEETSLLIELSETVSELSSTEETTIASTTKDEESIVDEEPIMDEAINNHTHNIYIGTIEEMDIRMKISRIDDALFASYITREDEEHSFEGAILNDTDFELKDKDGGYWKGTVKRDDAGFIQLSGTGVLSDKKIEFALTQDTRMVIGENFDNYYDGRGWAEEIEAFARQIKSSINDREKFIKLFHYPITIYIDKAPVYVQNEEEMAVHYDQLLAEDDIREEIEHMFTKYLFMNYLGACVEDGILWFSGNEITAWNYHHKR